MAFRQFAWALMRRALIANYLGQYALTVLMFASSLVLARLLTPHEIGIFSIAAVAGGIAHAVRDLGITNYILQENDLCADNLRSAIGLTTAVGWSLALVIALSSAPLGAFYAEVGVGDVLLVLALNFVLLPFCSVSAALLQREMRFGTIQLTRVVSNLIQAAVSIGMAWRGYSYMSLAWGGVAGTISTVLFLSLLRERAYPLLPGFRKVRHVFSKAARFSAASVCSELGEAAPDMITGKLVGIEAVGYLSRAVGAVSLARRLSTDSFFAVASAAFASKVREGAGLGESFLGALAHLSGLSWPFLFGVACASHLIVEVLYGEPWLPSAPLIAVLAVSGAIMAVAAVGPSLAVGLGDAKLALRVQLLAQGFKVLAVFVLGWAFGLFGVVAAIALADCFFAWRYLSSIAAKVKVSGAEIWLAVRSSLLVGLLVVVTNLGLLWLNSEGPLLMRLLWQVVASIVAYLAGLFWTRHALLQVCLDSLGPKWPALQRWASARSKD